MNDVGQAVREIIAAHIQVDPATIAPEARLTEIGLSSLDVVEIVFALEQRFKVTLPFDAAENDLKFETVADVTRAVGDLMQRPA